MKKKALLAVCLTIAICVTPFLQNPAVHIANAQAQIRIVLGDKPLQLSTGAYIKDGATLVPVREIAEALGAKVVYGKENKGKKTVELTRGSRHATLTIGSTAMIANGKTIKLPVAPITKNNVTMVPLRAISESLGTVVSWDGMKRTVHIEEPAQLPSIGTVDKLVELLQTATGGNDPYNVLTGGPIFTLEEKNNEASAPNSSDPSSNVGREFGDSDDYSKTNVQVDGVDEADSAKTDGKFIYQISGTRVVIADISNPKQPKLAAELDYSKSSDGEFQPEQLYIEKGRLLVLGTHYPVYQTDPNQTQVNDAAKESVSSQAQAQTEPVSPSTPPTASKMAIWPPMYAKSAVKTFVYDLNSSGKPTLVRELAQEGSYLSSRKIGSSLYIVTNKYSYSAYPYPLSIREPINEGSEASRIAEARKGLASAFEPYYSDSSVSKEKLTLKLNDIHYFPEPVESSMMLVGSVDLSQQNQPLQLAAYLGAGEAIYASQKHLYVAQSAFKNTDNGGYERETRVHKFRLDSGSMVYIGEGTVPGALLNQFSMDEHEGYFRVALTKGNMWATGEEGSTNNVYVLNEKLETIGKLEGLAPGERIYSVRFMGARAYMVTFRNVDPLFAIDLSNPAAPKVLGQLKIPGYSDYLHPYDENHLIGFGKDTVELPSKGMGRDDTMAYYQGLKIALFDVSDVSQPKELFKQLIGDRGTDSELLHNHKALLFSKEKGLLAFPVQLHEVKNKTAGAEDDLTAYGEFVYQGAYVYRIDLQHGFQLRGRISHLSGEDLQKSGMYGYDYTKSVKRILYAGDTLYTLSDAMLKANELSTLSERGSLTYPSLPASENRYPGVIDSMPMATP
ncbi:beta-propeller domain-containing protein [Paenibacillus sp. GCM10027627]|uniref:beta-propeller domain-containing protein n=1 Tax=unclassified Paenibacillus TaxID=185978 RepID=UPI003630A533